MLYLRFTLEIYITNREAGKLNCEALWSSLAYGASEEG
jgi:hypothetical protein